MQLESHATPFGGTPQQRYASLHRSIEQGLDSDDVWIELASVSFQLGHSREAARCVARIQNAGQRAKLERQLGFGHPETAAPDRSTAAGNRPQRPGKVGRRDPATAPAASDAGPTSHPASQRDEGPPRVVEHLVDAGQYLMHQHMPWLVLSTMLAFPLVVGVGGFLTAGGSPLLLAAIAALPGLSVMVVVAAMGHEILRSSSDGDGDVPGLPEFPRLIRASRDFLFDALLVFAMYFAGPIALGILGAPLSATLPGLAVGVFAAPLTFALRQVRRDMRSFSPVFLLRALRRSGAGYVVVAVAIALAFAPAALVAKAVISYPVWVQIAIIGPLCVLPTFTTTRLLGTWLDSHRKSLGYLMIGPKETLQSGPGAAAVSAPKKPTQPRNLRRPANRNAFEAPKIKKARRSGSPAPAVRPASAFAEKPKSRPAPRAIEGRRPAPKSPAPAPAKATQDPALKDVPDLVGMPGAVVVSGSERERKGAASRRS